MKNKRLFIAFFSLIFIIIHSSCFALDNESLYSESAIVIDSYTGQVLYDKNIDQKMYPASLTKVMTAIIAIENCKLDEVVTVNYNAISSIPSGYATAELTADENITVKQLLEVLLIHSANDAANVLAMHVGGSIESFVSMMNSKAKELHCENTNFTNTYGLQDENHYSTARDLAKITKYCMENSSFRHFVAQLDCQIPPTNKHDARTFKNTNDLILPSSQHYYPHAIGVKTGYTKEAGNCLIGASKKDGFETISVVLNSGVVHGARATDTIQLFNYAYDNYEMKQIASKGNILSNINVFNGSMETSDLNLLLSEDLNVLIKKGDNLEKITPTINLKSNVSAPLAAGTVVGTATYELLNTKYTVDLVAEHDVQKSDFTYMLLCIGVIVIFLIGVIVILVIFLIKRKRKNKNYDVYGI